MVQINGNGHGDTVKEVMWLSTCRTTKYWQKSLNIPWTDLKHVLITSLQCRWYQFIKFENLAMQPYFCTMEQCKPSKFWRASRTHTYHSKIVSRIVSKICNFPHSNSFPYKSKNNYQNAHIQWWKFTRFAENEITFSSESKPSKLRKIRKLFHTYHIVYLQEKSIRHGHFQLAKVKVSRISIQRQLKQEWMKLCRSQPHRRVAASYIIVNVTAI